MANQTSARQSFQNIRKLIDSSRFNESFLLIKRGFQNFDSLRNQLDSVLTVESNYKYMLEFLALGHSDPSQKEMMEQIRDSLHHFNDMLLRESKLKDSSDLFSSTRRLFNLKETKLENLINNFLALQEAHDAFSPELNAALDEIFNYIWTMASDPKGEYQIVSDVLDNPEAPEYLKASVISALTLGALSYLDYEYIEILLNFYEKTESVVLKSRALVGILLLSLIYNRRLAGNLKLRSRLILSEKDESVRGYIAEALMSIVKTYDTTRIDNKMRNEVIPGLMKIQPEIMDRMKNMARDSEDFLSDENPQWEELFENSEVGEKLREINDLQMEGADVMVTAFSSLKSFPFFNMLSNWFLPFMPDNHEFLSLNIDTEEDIFSHLSIMMCDSDLHSFMLSLVNMPSSQREMVITNMKAQMKEAFEAMSGPTGITQQQEMAMTMRHYLQDMYRFFKFNKKNTEITDPFSSPFVASDIETLMPLWDISSDDILLISEFYFKNKYYPEAAEYFKLYNSLENGQQGIWEKIGYCIDRTGKYEEAVEWYKKAEILNPDTPWLDKKLAIALKNAARPEEAVKYYEKVLLNEPENYHLLMSAGQCWLEMGEYANALQKFHHANYLKPEKKAPLRAIAWTELLSLNLEKARSSYSKLISSPDSDGADFLNAAHAALADKDFKTALNLYKAYTEKSDNRDITSLVIAFRDDADILKKLGIKTTDLRLIVDKIRYDFIS